MAGAVVGAVVAVLAEVVVGVAAEAAGASQALSPLRRPVQMRPTMKIRPRIWTMLVWAVEEVKTRQCAAVVAGWVQMHLIGFRCWALKSDQAYVILVSHRVRARRRRCRKRSAFLSMQLVETKKKLPKWTLFK